MLRGCRGPSARKVFFPSIEGRHERERLEDLPRGQGVQLVLQGGDRLLAATTCLRSSLVATNRGQRVPPDPSGRLLRRMSQSPFVCRSGCRRLCGPRRGAKPWWTRTSQEIPVPLCISKRRPTPNPRGLRRGGETLQPNCYTQAVLGWLPGCNGPHNKRPSICSGSFSARILQSPP